MLNNGGKGQRRTDMLTKETKWWVQTSTDFGSLAVYAYRRDSLQAVLGPSLRLPAPSAVT